MLIVVGIFMEERYNGSNSNSNSNGNSNRSNGIQTVIVTTTVAARKGWVGFFNAYK